MDTSEQLYETEATGWKRGLYEDVKRTFRAPFVNWIFRTTMANEPAFLRYAWGQVKPIFETRGFARFSAAYHDELLSVGDARELPTYRCEELELRPAEYRELRGQLATFDAVGPRLAALFEVMDRSLRGEPVGAGPDEAVGAGPDEARVATEPFPEWFDRDRGLPPTMVAPDGVPDELEETVDAIEAFHGLGDQLPSVYRCLAQWPGYLTRAWGDLEPVFRSDEFDAAGERVDDRLDRFVRSTPYRPRLAPEDLRGVGFDGETIDGVQWLFRRFNRGPARGVVRTLPAYASTVDAAGRRTGP
ncbi:halocarboxylic acid dehydrogenase DehI family protein [Halegenticoccus soli]|uniref:halocarboxylic acid dehydrogenase DehI family protein n=1 Tax=Halegenticoccus soli TaxID=1985678 RepID=UPI000C6CAF72|nr:halocarboxylic acid dehydrogenase DehI family protein [Halegenticoccus soli]